MRLDKVSSERIEVLRFPLIVGVVLIHVCGKVNISTRMLDLQTPSYLADFVQNLISHGIAQISVPLFFTMSGYFFFLGMSWSASNYKAKLKTRRKTLLVPFLFWNIATLSIFAIVQQFPAAQVYLSGKNAPISSFGVYDYINAMIGLDGPPISYQFWYIRDLMAMVLLTPIIYVILRRLPKAGLGCTLMLWFCDAWPIYAPSAEAFTFFYLGSYLAFLNRSLFFMDRFGKAMLLFFVPILLLDALTKGYAFNIYIHNAGELLGIAAALYLSKAMVGREGLKRALLWAATSSFFIFSVHEPLLLVTRKFLYKAIEPSSGGAVLGLYFGISAFVIVFSLLLYASMKSMTPKFLKVICGGRSLTPAASQTHLRPTSVFSPTTSLSMDNLFSE